MNVNINGVMMQFYHWHLNRNLYYEGKINLWEFLEQQADYLREIGITAVWIEDGVGLI